MLGILHHIREFLLSALKRYSPGRLLQYWLALCRAIFRRSKSKCSDQDPSPTLAEGMESLSEGSITTPIGHVISACRTHAQAEAGSAQTSPPCVCDQLLPMVYANHHHLVRGMTVLSERMCALQVMFHSETAYFTCGPTVRVCLTW